MKDHTDPVAALATRKLMLGLQVAGVGVGEVDYIADTITLDTRGAAMFDVVPDTPIPRDDFHQRIHPEDRIGIMCDVSKMLEPDGMHFMEVEHRVICADGGLRWLNARKQAIFARDPETDRLRPVTGIVAVMDVTDRKTAEAKMRFVMEEVSHRSKNLMAVMQTIARMAATNETEKMFAKRFAERMGALSFNHDLLVRNSWTHVQLSDLIRFHLDPFLSGGRAKASIEGPDTELGPDAAQAIGMALHELTTNAGKYGAFHVEGGQVAIRWSISDEDDPQFTMVWAESGGPPVKKPEVAGFGQKVLTRMAAQSLDGAVDLRYASDGLRWSLTAPARRVLRQVFD